MVTYTVLSPRGLDMEAPWINWAWDGSIIDSGSFLWSIGGPYNGNLMVRGSGFSVGPAGWAPQQGVVDSISATSSSPFFEIKGLSLPVERLFAFYLEGDDVMRPMMFQGNDVVLGGAGPDRLRGYEGADLIDGAEGADDINGNQGNDTVLGGAGDDRVLGGKDDDSLSGGAGADFVNGNLGADVIDGGPGDDTLRGGQGGDLLLGGEGDDWLYGDRGDDTLTGGAGSDVFEIYGGLGHDRVLDFKVAEGDRIRMASDDFVIRQVGADTVIEIADWDEGGGSIVLVGVTMDSLTGFWIFG